jgi:coenzyme Q-binding protein COQ10
MHHFECQKKVPFSKKEMAHLILDVENYKNFLPWIIESKVQNKQEKCFEGLLIFSYKGIQKGYTSRVIFEECEDDIYIKAIALDGPFQSLKSIWKISPDGDGQSLLNFSIDVTFSNFIYEKLFLNLFSQATEKTILAFEQQAFVLYRK